jgi:hypothetical protein
VQPIVGEDLSGVEDPISGLKFPNLNEPPFGGEAFETDLVLPEPCDFISKDLPDCSVIRPSSTPLAGAVAAVKALTADKLFDGQSADFFNTVMSLATAADAAQRQI